ncbi:MAG: hypothetical protein AAGC67_16745 [Myxococcota bacterium]
MTEFTWQTAYYSELQTVWALLVVPFAFLAWRAASPSDPTRACVPEAASFVSKATLVFAVLTMVDPLSTGLLAKQEGIEGTFAATLIMFFFVLLGDFRVLLLAIGVARPERTLRENLGWAAGLTLLVPIFAGVTYATLGLLIEDLHGQVLWMVYEAGFMVLCVALSRRWVPRSLGDDVGSVARVGYLRALFGYSAAYYVLWLGADVLIVAGGMDIGWGVRIVPNQLYYAFWVPVAYWRFYSVDPGAPNASR